MASTTVGCGVRHLHWSINLSTINIDHCSTNGDSSKGIQQEKNPAFEQNYKQSALVQMVCFALAARRPFAKRIDSLAIVVREPSTVITQLKLTRVRINKS